MSVALCSRPVSVVVERVYKVQYNHMQEITTNSCYVHSLCNTILILIPVCMIKGRY